MTNEEFIKNNKQVPAKRRYISLLKKKIEKLKKELDNTEKFVRFFEGELELYKGVPLRKGRFFCPNISFTTREANIYPKYYRPESTDWGVNLRIDRNENFRGCYYTEETAKKAGYEWVANGIIIEEVKVKREEYLKQYRAVETFLSSLSSPLTQVEIPELLKNIKTKRDEELAAKELIKFGYSEEETQQMVNHAMVVNGFVR